jgi:hypothetical protein
MEAELTMKRPQIILYVFAGIFFSTGTAMANNPPSGQTFLSVIAILTLMIIFSMIGGAYEVLKRLEPDTSSKALPILGIAMAIIFSMAHEGFAALVTVIFGIIAIVRGIQMLGWGLGALARGAKPVYLDAARPWRLIASSVFLMTLTVFLVGFSLVFHGSVVKEYKYRGMEEALKEFVAHQIVYAHGKKAKTGRSRFDEAAQDVYLRAYPNSRVEYSPDGNHFTVVLPPEDVPFFPYNYMTAVPSYRADETGQIRMIRAKRKGQLCPVDAPVIMKINVQDIKQERSDARQTAGTGSGRL